MIISLCIPCMNRTYDLKQTLPETIKAANASPPVEIVVLDYDSKDDLADYAKGVKNSTFLETGNKFIYAKSPNHPYFSISHARNLAVLASHGEYIVVLDADIIPHIDFVSTLREIIEREHPVWLVEGNPKRVPVMGRLPVIQRNEFIAMGGYDERFNVCGPEDKDICMRLHRRGGKFVAFSPTLVDEIHTPYREKFRHVDQRPYAGQGQMKLMMSRAMRKYYEENCANNVLVANPNGWGRWE